MEISVAINPALSSPTERNLRELASVQTNEEWWRSTHATGGPLAPAIFATLGTMVARWAMDHAINSDELKRVIEQLVAHVEKLTQELHNLQSICANQQQNLQRSDRMLSDLDTKLQKEEQKRILANYNSDHMDRLVRDALRVEGIDLMSDKPITPLELIPIVVRAIRRRTIDECEDYAIRVASNMSPVSMTDSILFSDTDDQDEALLVTSPVSGKRKFDELSTSDELSTPSDGTCSQASTVVQASPAGGAVLAAWIDTEPQFL
jgi:hypothetical protein